jgi:uncharacterized protein (TIGR02145 family)
MKAQFSKGKRFFTPTLVASIMLALALTLTSCAEDPANDIPQIACSDVMTGNGTITCGGQTYKTVVIGSQTWMAENLNYASKNSASVCYDNNKASCTKYGRLYTFEEAVRVCPSGWHLPKNSEWQTLIVHVGGFEVAGEKLKATSEWNWTGNGTDDYSFSALPGGLQYEAGHFGSLGSMGIWWASSGSQERFEDHFALDYNETTASIEECGTPQNKHSVRCIKD